MRLGSTYHFGKVIAKIHAGTELLYYQEAVDNAPKPAKRSITFKETAPGEGAAKKAKGR